MRTMPMRSAIEMHIKPDENDASRAELRRDVDGLKAGITAEADKARPREQHAVATLADFDHVNFGVARCRLTVAGELEAGEFGKPAAMAPPSSIAGIKNVRKRGEPPAFIYCDDPASPLRGLERELRRGRPGADDEADVSPPVTPPSGTKGP